MTSAVIVEINAPTSPIPEVEVVRGRCARAAEPVRQELQVEGICSGEREIDWEAVTLKGRSGAGDIRLLRG